MAENRHRIHLAIFLASGWRMDHLPLFGKAVVSDANVPTLSKFCALFLATWLESDFVFILSISSQEEDRTVIDTGS
eukprot:564624-Rhodomonas_salina.2